MQTLVPRSTLAAKPGMGTMKGLEQIGSRGYFRPTGTVTAQEAAAMVSAAIRTARDLGLADMLIDGTGASGFVSANTFDRYDFGTAWAAAAGSEFRVALVVKPEIVDFQKIGMLVAQNRNALADIFTTEAEALAWLDARLLPFRGGRPHTRPDER